MLPDRLEQRNNGLEKSYGGISVMFLQVSTVLSEGARESRDNVSGLSIGLRETRTAIGSLGHATCISESVSLLYGTNLSIMTGVESREGKSAPPALLVPQCEPNMKDRLQKYVLRITWIDKGQCRHEY